MNTIVPGSFLAFLIQLNMLLGGTLALSGILALIASILTPRYPRGGETVGVTASVVFGIFLLLALIIGSALIGRAFYVFL